MEKFYTFFYDKRENSINIVDFYLTEEDAKESCKKIEDLTFASESFLKQNKFI